jgi:hypothetical protein
VATATIEQLTARRISDLPGRRLGSNSDRFTRMPEMLWILTTMTAAVLIVAILALLLARRVPKVKTLGSMSSHWVGKHRLD